MFYLLSLSDYKRQQTNYLKMVNFGNIPESFSDRIDSEVVIIPVPYDGTSTWIKGADQGPDALLRASCNLELYDLETGTEVYRKGIFTDKPVLENHSPEQMIKHVFDRSMYWINKGKFIITLGGEHTVCLGTVKAFAEKFKDLSVIQIDAHADLRNSFNGLVYNHACVMARIREYCPIIQVGIRSMDIEERAMIEKERVFWAHEIRKGDKWMERVIGLLTDSVYITIDLDGLDPSIMPSTGTPEPGGMLWYQLLKLLKKVISVKSLVGFDIVELCPNESNKAPDFLAAKLLYKILSYKYQS
ncbi:MAG: agmatinase [Bacteroidales bacterium]|nr:MAG: agmatinase [Bacteroidales bacterium]